MRKVSWLVAGISLLLSIALISGCGYAKRDEVDKQMSDLEMSANDKIQLAQDAAAEASNKADEALTTAKAEIEKTKGEIISTVEEKDAETLAVAKSSMEEGDEAVRRSAEQAASKALGDAKAAAIAEDEKVKQTAKKAADEAKGAADKAQERAEQAAEEAELAKELPKPKEEPIVFTVYFALGQTKLSEESLAELERAAGAIKANPNAAVSVEGHTDNVPVVHSSRYQNNWGLSQARAKVVKDHLVDKLGVPAGSIEEAVGVAFYKPAAPNDIKNRKLNRRVEVTIMPQD